MNSKATLKAFFVWLILLALTGCSSAPRTESEHMCKSCKPYFVRGSWHYPQTHYEYDAEGLASWYGPGFNGKPKPYGEPFNQNAITAAHRTLPLPTVAEVTNLETGKSIVVLIDDRGPYVYAGRIIDLSVGAAKALGTYSKGIAKVRVRSLVAESQAFAKHLRKYGKSGRDPSGRTWRQILDQDILPRRGQYHVMTKDPKLFDELPAEIIKAKKNLQSKKTGAFQPSMLAEKTFITVGPQFYDINQAKQYLQKIGASPVLAKQTGLVKKIIQVTKNHKTWYNVRVGPFDSNKQAKQALQHIMVK